jgi:heat shock protein HtpX
MYITLILSFAIGFGIIYAVMFYMGADTYIILLVALAYFIIQWYVSPKILAAASKLHYITGNEYPQIQQFVKSAADSAKVPVPRIAIAPAKDPNAFVFGRTRRSATLVIHEGLLARLNSDELKAVIEHEIGHLRHNDVIIMTMVAFIPMLAFIIAQNILWAGMFNDSRNSSSYIMLLGVVAFIVYFVAEMLMLSLSRARESYADSYSASATKKPGDLASALLKITASGAAAPASSNNSTVARSLYIVDFFNVEKDIKDLKTHINEIKELVPDIDINRLVSEARKNRGGPLNALNSMFATHPPTYKRIVDLARIKKDL